jgi:hypothetical protein
MDIIGFDAQINAPRTVAPRTVAPRTVAPRAVAPKTVAPRAVAPRAVAPRKITRFAPAQVLFNRNAVKPMAIVKPSGQVLPVQNKAISVSRLENTRNPKTVMAASPVQRSFMPVDLPFQIPTSKSKFVRIVNTPFKYPVNIDMIEPAVDAGSGNYYGK